MDLRLKEKIFIGDGAFGTQLQALAGKAVMLPESLNLDPAGLELVGRVHEQYIQAGAEIIETNTFAANFPRLDRFGLGGECERINAMGAEIARKSAAGRALVAGSVGPLDLGAAATADDARLMEAYFRSQVNALKNGGVDLFMLETFSSPLEARAALLAAGDTGLPVFFSIGGQSISRPYARKSVLEMIALANRFKAAAFGVNCVNPYDLGLVLNIVADNTDLHLMAYPNAGTPSIERGLVRYDLPVTVLIDEAHKWLEKGVVVFGGCCGTSPDHIRALSSAFGGRSPVTRVGKRAGAVEIAVVSRTGEKLDRITVAANTVRAALHSGRRPLIAVEVKPVLSRSLQATVEAMKPIAECGVDFLDVPDNPAANPGRDCMACASLLQSKYSLPVIIHKTATQTNALHVSSYLLGAADLGIEGILAVTGDPPSAGAFDRIATRVNDLRNSIELLRLISLLRAGMLVNGQSLPAPVDFAAGCAFAHGSNLNSQGPWLAKKVEAGAEFVFTQPVFSQDDYCRVYEALGKFSLKKFIGVLPLLSA
ncbi:MAG: homocysteine S-methyltransferase family protein, partial [Kiritimatiellia bacterium]|nr:homocysteine S-methyltransferase family protein [Kiritimatiellia bacterium]